MVNKKMKPAFDAGIYDVANPITAAALTDFSKYCYPDNIATDYAGAAFSAAMAKNVATENWKGLVGAEALASLQSAAVMNEAMTLPCLKSIEESRKFNDIASEMSKLIATEGFSAAENYRSELEAALVSNSKTYASQFLDNIKPGRIQE